MRIRRRLALGAIGLCLSLGLGACATSKAPSTGSTPAAWGSGDPLPSWRDGPTKQSILSFVTAATDENSSGFVPVEDRIATFDNDGTLWCEQPLAELEFTKERLAAVVAKDPTLKERQPYKAALEGDLAALHQQGMQAILELVVATHGDMSREQFMADARAFFDTALHPELGVPYQELAYRPMVELLQYLRENGFQTWMCTGGWKDFARVISVEAYAIPPQQVIGSSLKMQYREEGGQRSLWILPELLAFCDKETKPVEIGSQAGKRPVFAAGNVRSGGDIAMLTWCKEREGASFQLLVNHDDGAREFAYSEPQDESLAAAREQGWAVVSIKDDWERVFAD